MHGAWTLKRPQVNRQVPEKRQFSNSNGQAAPKRGACLYLLAVHLHHSDGKQSLLTFAVVPC